MQGETSEAVPSCALKLRMRCRFMRPILVVRPKGVKFYNPLIEFSKRIALNSYRSPAAKVARVVSQALRARNPKRRYMVGIDARFLKLISQLPCLVRDWIILKALPSYGYELNKL
jgi:hypothetical protein